MSLEHLKSSRNIIHPILAVSFINFVLIIVVLVMSTTIFAIPSGFSMRFPSFGEDVNPSGQPLVVTVTSENVIYTDGRVTTLNEFRRFLAQRDFRGHTIMIKADRGSSMGRVADILDLCRGIPGATVNVSTIL